MCRFAIIVAGGQGLRMGAEIPKQFLSILGKPVLMHTLECFQEADSTISLVLVLPKDQFGYWEQLCSHHNFSLSYLLTEGGDSRFASVRNGLAAIKANDGLVAVHDGVRPLVSTKVILNSFEVAEKNGTAIASVALKDSIREIGEGRSKAVNRMRFRLVQTPQTFQLNLLRNAFSFASAIEDKGMFTDDASVVEYFGHQIELIEGDYQNIKLTTPEDLMIAENLLINKL